MSNSQNEYDTHEKPKRPKWCARCPLTPAPGALKRGPFGIFQLPSVAKHQKFEGGPFGKTFFKKSLTVPKQLKGGDPLVSPSIVCYAEKDETLFWFSSLDQIDSSSWDHKSS